MAWRETLLKYHSAKNGEPFGLVMIEALACGTPVIATPNGAAPELIDHGTTGYLATTPADLVQAVSVVDQISRATCRQHAEQRYAMSIMARHHEQLYHAAIQQHQTLHQARSRRPPRRAER